MERRGRADRRKHPRGGRRPGDKPGYSPLVLVVDKDESRRARSEAILQRFRFAVVQANSVEMALAILHGARPAVILCQSGDLGRLRQGVGQDSALVEVTDMLLGTDAIVEAIRIRLRSPRG